MRKGFRFALIGACILANLALTSDARLLPPWLKELIEREAPHRYAIWEVTVDNELAYNFITGAEMNEVYSEDGAWLCRWGGYSGSVMSGSCPGQMAFVRLIFPAGSKTQVQAEEPAGGWSLY